MAYQTELYDFRVAYGVPDMSAVSLNAILNRMMRYHVMRNKLKRSIMAAATVSSVSLVDPMANYCRYIVGTSLPRLCPVIDQAEIWCGAQTSDPETVQTCVRNYSGAEELVKVVPRRPCGNGNRRWLVMTSENHIACLIIVMLVGVKNYMLLL